MNTPLAKHILASSPLPISRWAEDFGVSRPHLYALMEGTRQPSLATAKRIEAATHGAVPITAWENLRAVVEAASHTGSPASDVEAS